MTTDLTARLEEYCRFLDETLPTVNAETVLERGVYPVSPPPPRPQRGWVVAVTAAVAVFVVGGAVALLLQDRDPGADATATTVAPTTVAPTTVAPTTVAPTTVVPTTVASTTVAPATTPPIPAVQTAVTWERVPEQPALDRAALYDVVEHEGRLVAVGYALEPDVGGLDLDTDWASDPAVWVSDDGVEWRRIDDPDLDSDDQFGLIDQVVVGPAGLLAVGYAGRDLVLWSSSDGEEWDRAADVIGGVEWLVPVPVEDGWLAIGNSAVGDPQVWRSSDGSEWTAVPDPAFTSIAPGYTTVVMDVVATDAGIVAVGNDGAGDHPSAIDGYTICGAIWFSPDGGAWERIAPERICEAEASFESVAVFPSGTVYALGWAFDLWLATDPADADAWQPMGIGDGLRCAPEAWLGDIVAGVGRWSEFVCVSEDEARTWLPVDRNDGAFADGVPAGGVVAFDGKYVAAGYYGYAWAGQPWVVGGGTGALWIGTPTGE